MAKKFPIGRPPIPQRTRDAIKRRLLTGETPKKVIEQYGGRFKALVYEIRRRLIDSGELI